MREKGQKSLTIVIKLGTSSIVDEKTHQPLLSILSLIVETAVKLRSDGHKVIIVSSGAIGVGLRRMDLDKRPKHLPRIQALAAIGQCRLISLWDSLFNHLRQPIAQILLTRNDIADRTQYLNAQNTFAELLDMGVIPIVNENDTIAVTEIKFGDNDTLSAITAAMVHADYLFLMTDVDCLYDKNPRTNPDAQTIEVVEDIAALQADVSSAGSSLGTGGMSTKIVAARLATSAGVTTVITRSSKPGNIADIVTYCQSLKPLPYLTRSSSPLPLSNPTTPPSGENIGAVISSTTSVVPTSSIDVAAVAAAQNLKPKLDAPLHTRFIPSPHPIRDRYFWLLHGLAPHGTIYIDAGAHRALQNKAGLFPVGVVDVVGSFSQQEAVRIVVVKKIKPSALPSSTTTSHISTPNPSASTTSLLSSQASTPSTFTPTSSVAPSLMSGVPGATTSKLWEGPGVEVGRAVVNYSAAEIMRIKGVKSSEIHGLLGYADSEYVALRENISFFVRESRPVSPSLE